MVTLDSDEEEEEDTETERLAELAKGMHQVEREKHAMCETYIHIIVMSISSPRAASGTGGYPSSSITTLVKKRSTR